MIRCRRRYVYAELFSCECVSVIFFFFQAEDGIRDDLVTGVQTCALPICCGPEAPRVQRSCTMPSPPEIAAPANTLPPPETTTKFTIWPFTAWPRESSTSATSGFGNSVPGGAVWLLPETTDRDSAPGARFRMSDGERQEASSRSPEIRAIVEERTSPPSKAIVETIAPTRGAARLTRPEPASHHQSTRTREGYNPPMTSRTAALLVVLASAVSVCRPAPESRAPRERASAVAQQDTQDTAFAGTLAPVQRVRSFRPGVARPVLRHVETRAGASPGGGYDRGVFEFTGASVPGYRVEYTTKPVQRCGSGDPVTVAGAGRLIVRFEPALAHDEHGNLSPAERHRAPGLPAVRE